MEPLKQTFDCDIEKDDTAIFYSREFGGHRIVIIPKNRFTFAETESTYILTQIEKE